MATGWERRAGRQPDNPPMPRKRERVRPEVVEGGEDAALNSDGGSAPDQTKGVVSECVDVIDKIICAIEDGKRSENPDGRVLLVGVNFPTDRMSTPNADKAHIHFISLEYLNSEGPAQIERLKAMKNEFVNWFEALVRERTQEIFAHAPNSLGVTGCEKQQISAFVRRELDHAPTASWSDLLWRSALAGLRPSKRGAPPKWSGLAGRMLAIDVEGRLWLKGKQRSDRKAIRNIVHEIREQNLARYGAWSEQTLRDAYYQVIRRLKAGARGPG
jgi:hypothetical protein